jgi:hypothetical protein
LHQLGLGRTQALIGITQLLVLLRQRCKRFSAIQLGHANAQQRTHARQQLIAMKRLGQIIIGSGVETGNAIG